MKAVLPRHNGWGNIPSDGTYRVKDVQKCERISTLFERVSQRYPDATAVHALCEGVATDGDTRYRTYTYRELNHITSVVAVNIRGRTKHTQITHTNVGPCICICVHEGSPLVIANLAVLKAGAALVPVSPFEPASRLRKIIDDIQPIMVRAFM